VVGFSPIAAGPLGGVVHAFEYRNGEMTDLGTLGGPISQAYGVDMHGEVVGQSLLANVDDSEPFLYKNGKMTGLGTLGGNNGVAYAINDRGTIVGYANLASGVTEAFVYKNGVMKNLNSLIPRNAGYNIGQAVAINDRGQILAWAQPENAPAFHLAVLVLTPEPDPRHA
jgi:probable HAF family extracellular repeat protein